MITNLEIGYNGRLGNQMFQYAVCYAVAKKLNTQFSILNQNSKHTKSDGCFDFANNQWIAYRLKMYDCFNITAPQVGSIPITNTFQEPHFHYSDTINSVQDNTSIQGYYQSEKYFLDCKEDILKEFTFKNEILNASLSFLKDNFNSNPIVAVHIRRGDNIHSNPTFPPISMEYIQQALNEFTDQEYNFLILSDDIPYCKEVFPEGGNIKFSSGDSDLIDLCLMTLADHNIISNSSYSWWGAYLNSNSNKKVIAPSNWFKDKINMNTKDLIPDNWKII